MLINELSTTLLFVLPFSLPLYGCPFFNICTNFIENIDSMFWSSQKRPKTSRRKDSIFFFCNKLLELK